MTLGGETLQRAAAWEKGWVMSQTLPTHSQTTQARIKTATREAGEVNLSLAAKYWAELLHNDCWASGDMLFHKFRRVNVGWKHVDVLAIFDMENHDAAHTLTVTLA